MTGVILHIGMQRTGSSSIQKTLAGFYDGRTRYARLGFLPNHSLAMMHIFSTDETLPHATNVRRGHSTEEVAAYTARLRATLPAGGERLVLSAQSF
jgi:hypothetical protein